MSLVSLLSAGFQRVGNEAKTLRTLINGNVSDLSALNTTAKANLVAAINDVQQQLVTVSGGAAGINDGGQSSASTWSSNKIAAQIETARQSILGGTPAAALDPLVELAARFAADGDALAALVADVSNRVRFDAPQALSDPQKFQVRGNIGAASAVDVGDTSTNFVTVFETALAS